MAEDTGGQASDWSPEDYLAWHHLSVEGRPATYGVGGTGGPQVVFLHGWAMGSRAYKRAIRRLTSRGCQVFAPALPSFGGTADLPASEFTMKGYADWVASFMDEVGIDQPVLLIGHSFGGGVAIQLADLYPQRVKYIVLLNTVGGTSPRPPWEWVLGLARELWPLPQGLEMLQAMGSDLVPNVLRNPIGLMRAGRLAQMADLRSEAASLKARGLPMLVLTSEGDGVIPHEAFSSLCQLIGTDGQVVRGRHSWLLANPDSFDEVLASIIDLEVAAHESSSAEQRTTEIERLLRRTRISWRSMAPLLKAAPPLWLMSQAAVALAGDLVLCQPPLKEKEVRAVARLVEGTDGIRLTVVTADRPGLLADSAALLADDGLSITEACAVTWSDRNLALHSFTLDAGAAFDAARWRLLGKQLQTMVGGSSRQSTAHEAFQAVRVTIHRSGERSIVKVTARNEIGLLSAICRWFEEQGINIESLHARTTAETARDTFLVVGQVNGGALERFLTRPVGLRMLHQAG